MTWMEIYDELDRAQSEFFSDGSLAAFAPVPKQWEELERLLRATDAETRQRLDSSIVEFTRTGDWPADYSPREKVIMYQRLHHACTIALRLSVPFMSNAESARIEVPPIPTSDVLRWLLNTQWEVLGVDSWIADVAVVFQAIHTQHEAALMDWFWDPRKRLPPKKHGP